MAVAERAKIPPFLMTIMVGARLHRRGSVADRPDGDHRHRPDAPDGDVGIRAAELPLEPRGQRRGAGAGYLAFGGVAAVLPAP